jgi:hypothetical protein
MKKHLLVCAIMFSAAGRMATPVAAADAASPPVLSVTPSGEGDPNMVVCRAPQKLADSEAFGPKACAANSIWADLAAKGRDLGPDAKTVIERPTVDEPNGEGNPDAVTCRKPPVLPSAYHMRSYGPEICLSNAHWAKMKADNKRITEDGRSIVDSRGPAGVSGPFGTPGIPSPSAQEVH